MEEKIVRRHKFTDLKSLNVEIRSFGAYSLNNDVTYVEDGIPFIRGVNMKNGRVDFEDMLYIDEKAHKLLWKSEVKPEMVLLSMSGTIGDVAIASKKWKYPINSNQDIAKIDTKGKLNPYYLYAFLMSKFGQNYLKREARGSVQQHVFLSQIERFEIPLVSDEFSKCIQDVVERSEDTLFKSKELYLQAEKILLEEVGLSDFKPSKKSINVKSFKDSFLSTGRLDAEYYQPKYEEIENHIKKFRHSKVSELVTFINHGKQPPYVENGTIRVFSQKWIKDKGIDYSFLDSKDEPFTSEDFAKQHSEYVARKYDILYYSVGANLGYCHNYLLEEPIMPGSFITIIRADKDKINPIYLGIALNSILGRLQAEKWKSASAQPYIYPKDISEFLIPIIDIEKQLKIEALVEESFRLNQQSKHLLKVAIKAVEIAIEQDEDTAMSFINNHLSKI
ncbi:restriction endonuclease subunit S [Geobacillus sp. CAMR5420]|uniref:restriction endonuclease subunit S n=1 Tax=Geobacillus sp. CAMR5420 TaxID=1482739 RepID=UPI000FFF5FB9|nr:restriction endonuclease subunit S [Geobacillus sp. CAMR5420]